MRPGGSSGGGGSPGTPAGSGSAVFAGVVAVHSLAVGLQGFERRLEQLVEGTFGKAFPSGLQPVEVGRKVTRTLDAERTVGVDGVPIAPNNLGVYLAPEDFDRFHDFADALARELAEVARRVRPIRGLPVRRPRHGHVGGRRRVAGR